VSPYAAFLRGMNVGGHRLTNEELRAYFTAMGFGGVATFRASGNVVFAAPAQPPRALAARIEQGLAAALGYEVPTFIREAREVRAMAAMRPFADERLRACGGKLQVALLSVPPSPSAREAVLALASESDGLAFGERELYWLPNGGILDSALDLKAIGKLLGAMTMRTKNTIEQLAGRHFRG
jgi:uncharacterized protein (DUF1697 family)